MKIIKLVHFMSLKKLQKYKSISTYFEATLAANLLRYGTRIKFTFISRLQIISERTWPQTFTKNHKHYNTNWLNFHVYCYSIWWINHNTKKINITRQRIKTVLCVWFKKLMTVSQGTSNGRYLAEFNEDETVRERTGHPPRPRKRSR